MTLGLGNVLVFYNIVRVMGPAFEGSQPSEKSVGSFVGGREKSESPVDVAPPVAAFTRPAKAFPPPRSVSTISTSDSTRALLASRYRHAYTGSVASTSESMSVGRPITPMSDLNEIIATPEPAAATRDKQLFHLNTTVPEEMSASLPAPRRSVRAVVVSQSMDQSMLTAVPLKTPASAAFPRNVSSQRDSFINMYASRSPVPEPESSTSSQTKTRFAPPTLVLNDSEAADVPSSGSASDYTSASTTSDVPSSAFADRKQLSSRSFRSIVRDRTSVINAPESDLSPLAWASLVTDAAMSNGGVPVQPSDKAARRRSRSLDAVPQTLRPRVPASAALRREFATVHALMPPVSAGLAPRTQNRLARWDSKAAVRQGPSKTSTLHTSSDPI